MSMKINEIKEIFEKTPVDDIPKTAAAFKDDERSGVKKLVERYEKKYAAHLAELERLAEISAFEKGLREKGFRLIAGIDEVGRGPLAGPVMTAAVILPENCVIEGINDSKKLSPAKREALSAVIKEKAVSFAFGSASPEEIDEINILQATYRAMRKAIAALDPEPDFVLADAVTIPDIAVSQRGIIHGDAKSVSIGAASIIAKVERDAMMNIYGELYPGYGFEKNKGYGSAEHIEALKRLGPCPIHRKSFIKNFVEL